MLGFFEDCYFYVLYLTVALIFFKVCFALIADGAANSIMNANNREKEDWGVKHLKWSLKGSFNWNFAKARKDASEFRCEEGMSELGCFHLCVLFLVHVLQALVNRFSITTTVKQKRKNLRKNLTITEQEKLYKRFCKYHKRTVGVNRFLLPLGICLALPFIMHLMEFFIFRFFGASIFGGIAQSATWMVSIGAVSLLILVASRVVFSRETGGLVSRRLHEMELDALDKQKMREIIERNKDRERLVSQSKIGIDKESIY